VREPVVPPRAPSFFLRHPSRLFGSRRAKPGFAGKSPISGVAQTL
jgi:hypothetical protein